MSVLLLSVCLIRSSAVFDDDVDQQSREYQDDEYDRDSVASKQSGNRSGQASTRGAYQWPERGQAALGVKKVLQPFNGLVSRTTWVSRYQKGKTNLDFTGARDSEWQWHWLGHMHVCTSLQTDNHASTPPLCFLQAGCPSCHPTNSVKALKAP